MSPAAEGKGRDPGPPDARTAAPEAFDQIAVFGPFLVKVSTGKSASISLRGPRTMLDDTELFVRGGKLIIRWQEGASWSRNGDHGVDIDIALPALTETTIGESGSIEIDRIEGDRFAAMLYSSGGITIHALQVKNLDALLAGAGVLVIERIDAEAVDIKLAGSGGMRATGRAGTATLMIGGSGSFDNPNFIADDASIIVIGSGGVRATVTHSADIKSMGSGEINLTGGAKLTVSKGGAGTVTCT